MATHIEHEMTSCLSEMERLQAKMMELQETKKKQEAEQENKTNNTEPNMAVMENWLGSVIGERENAKKAKKHYESLTKDTPEENRREILNLWRIYNKTGVWASPSSEPLFHIKKYKAPDTPSQFMIEYIEATHNLFQIQQKRIDALESVVAELSAKIEYG